MNLSMKVPGEPQTFPVYDKNRGKNNNLPMDVWYYVPGYLNGDHRYSWWTKLKPYYRTC